MSKEDLAPWYVVVCRIVLFLLIWLCLAVFYFVGPFLIDVICMALFDDPDPIFFNLFLDHQWLFYFWVFASLLWSLYSLVSSVVKCFTR